jgi:hypothetical protein
MYSTVYTQPFGSDSLTDAKAFCDNMGELVSIIIGRRNLSGILTVLVESVDKATCQHCGLHTTEVNSCHTIGWNGGLHWESRGEIESGIWDEWGVTVAVLILFSTPSTALEIM